MMSQSFYNNPREYMFNHGELIVLGVVTMIYIIITVIVAIKFLNKYFEFKNKVFIYGGISYFGVASCWFGVGLNFVLVMFFNVIPPMELHFLLHGAIVTYPQWCWFLLISYLFHMRHNIRKVLTITTGILATIVEILYIYIVFTNVGLLGRLVAPIQVVYGPFSYIYLSIHLLIFVAQGLLLGYNSTKSEDKRVKLKGKFLLSSFLFFLSGSLLEVFFNQIPVFIVARILIAISAIFFYFGFILPKRIEKIFLKS